MTENDPTNKELLHYIKDIKEKVEDIKIQVTKTNGRVGNLEIWRGTIIGAVAVITVLIVPLILNLLKQ